MKLKDDFILRNIAGQTVVLPSGGDLDLNMMITLNETGAFLWERMQQETDEAALLTEYDVDEVRASAAVTAFVQKLEANGFLA